MCVCVYIYIYIYTYFYSFQRSQIFVAVWETDGDKKMNEDCHIDPLLLLLTLPRCVIFKAPHRTSTFRWWSTKWEANCGSFCGQLSLRGTQCPSGANLISYSRKLRLRIYTPLPVSHVGILIYHFITHTEFNPNTWLILLVVTGASRTENLWLTTRSRVNLLHEVEL